jgi:two-component system response regulator FixJ
MSIDNTVSLLIALADDEDCVREGLVSLLRSCRGAATAFASAMALLASGRLLKVACLVLAVRMPEVDGLHLQWVTPGADGAAPTVSINGHADRRERAVRGGMARPSITTTIRN